MKIATIIGARPQIIKAAALSRAIQQHFSDSIQEIIIHTGQHFDENMSEVFFAELQIPQPHYNLNCRAGSGDAQMEVMIEKLSAIFQQERPDAVIVFGDTNSTLAGSKAAHLLQIPLIHIEAGLRSFNNEMPEERNRYESDHLSTLLFAPTNAAIENLRNEGIRNNLPPYSLNNPGIFHCGDIMFDNTLFFKELSNKKEQLLHDLQLHKASYILATIHRNFNTDNPERLLQIFDALQELAANRRVVVPLHPRTRKAIETSLSHKQQQQIWNSKITLTEPLSFLEITLLEAHCSLIITDSGGVQKEAFFFQKPSVILRPETEWIEIVECGAAKLSDANCIKIIEDANTFLNHPPQHFPELFGNGRAAEEICSEILKWYQSH